MPGAQADTFHMYDGKVIQGNVIDCTGDIIRYRQGRLIQGTLKRLELRSKWDVVTLKDGQVFEGEIVYIDDFKIELRSSNMGKYSIWRIKVKDIVFGKDLASAAAY
jgi:hypothetical protein